MKAVVVREVGTNRIVAMGPANGMYEPGYHSATQVRQEEADYEAVRQEWLATRPPIIDKRAVILADARVPQWFKDWMDL